MYILKLLVGAALLCAAVNCNAQTTYQVRPAPFTGGYNVYQNGIQTQQVRPAPFTGGYNVYQNGIQTQQIRPAPFTGGYNIQTYGR